MTSDLDGTAVVLCEGAFLTPIGKTAHGLIRFTRRYKIASVIDSTAVEALGSASGRLDAGLALDGQERGIPLVSSLEEALAEASAKGLKVSHLVVGLAPDGGRLDKHHRAVVARALGQGLNVDAGLHDFLSEDEELARLARGSEVEIRDVRRPPARQDLHFFSGRIDEVASFRLALLGTDSAVGKRTTAWLLTDALNAAGMATEMIGTGQTAWLQGAEFGIVLDSLINDFVSGELENAVLRAWEAKRPQAMILEGQGSLLNPAYPGGFEILAACRPQAIVLQHAPGRRDYDGFPGRAIDPLDRQLEALRLIGRAPVVAITLNHEGLAPEEVDPLCREIATQTGLPVMDPLIHGVAELAELVGGLVQTHRQTGSGR